MMALKQRVLDAVDELSVLVNWLWCGKWHYEKGFDLSMQKNVERLGQGIHELGPRMS